MTKIFSFGSWVPTEVDLAALEACLVSDVARAGAAFERWTSLYPATPGNDRLYALLVAVARRNGWAHPLLDDIVASARGTATFSMLVRHHGIAVLRDLMEHGFRPVVLKGLALQAFAYSMASHRPVTDLDVLFSESEAAAVVAYLRSQGWRSPAKDCFGPGHFASYAGANFGHGAYEQLDVHWRFSHWCRVPQLTAAMLERAVPLVLDDVEVFTLDPTDHLVHAIAHGVAWESGSSVRWVVDATNLVRHTAIDWDRFVYDTVRGGFGPAASEAIGFLSGYLHVEIPPGVLVELDRRYSARDRAVHWIRTGRPTRARLAIRLLFTDYLARTADHGMIERAVNYPAFLVRTFRDSKTHRIAG